MAKPNSKAPVGQGGRFAALSAKLNAQGAQNPNALAAYIGKKKYGSGHFAQLAAKGKKKKGKTKTDSAGDTYTPGAKFDSHGDRILGSRDSRGDRLK